MTKDQLIKVGMALYGPNWRNSLAVAIHYDPASIWRATKSGKVSPRMAREVERLAEKNSIMV